jgi:hypothetical protein
MEIKAEGGRRAQDVSAALHDFAVFSVIVDAAKQVRDQSGEFLNVVVIHVLRCVPSNCLVLLDGCDSAHS